MRAVVEGVCEVLADEPCDAGLCFLDLDDGRCALLGLCFGHVAQKMRKGCCGPERDGYGRIIMLVMVTIKVYLIIMRMVIIVIITSRM